jgi:hypothetical protein
MPGGPWPSSPSFDFATAELEYHIHAPLLVTGDRAVLLLEVIAKTGELEVQGVSGHYKVEAGRVNPLEYNRFRADIDGLTETAFVDRVRAELTR